MRRSTKLSQAEYARIYRARKIAAGLCVQCGKRAAGPKRKQHCDPCGANSNRYAARYRDRCRAEATAAGLCSVCYPAHIVQAEPGKIHCARCLTKRAVRALKQQGCDASVDTLMAMPKQCEVCGYVERNGGPKKNGAKNSLCFDHDHDTHVLRGVLCHSCNRAIGLMADDPDRLLAAVRYLNAKKPSPYWKKAVA